MDIMLSSNYQVQSIHQYSRKSYKKGQRQDRDLSNTPDTNQDAEPSPKSDACPVVDSPECSCELDPEGEITNILLHKKCTVISLAQHQLQKLLEERSRIVNDDPRHCSQLFQLLYLCKEVLLSQNKYQYVLIALIVIAFFIGFLFGAGTCGTYLGKLNNPILNCIDNYFIPDSYFSMEDTFRSIA